LAFVAGHDGTLLQWNGSAWSRACPGVNNDLFGVWGSSGTDVFATGERMILHGGSNGPWTLQAFGVDVDDVFAVSANDLFAVASGSVLRGDGNSWSHMIANPGGHLSALWGSSAQDVFAVGHVLQHFDGAVDRDAARRHDGRLAGRHLGKWSTDGVETTSATDGTA
jgi:hypothetical protein